MKLPLVLTWAALCVAAPTSAGAETGSDAGAVATRPADDFEARIDEILGQLTTAEKVSLIHGYEDMSWGGIARLGIPRVGMNDGPQGVRGPAATAFPCGIALAATWDPTLVGTGARVMGLETLANHGNRVHLGPAVNLMRTPLGGRTFEYMGEDPLLAGRIAAGYINGLQSTGVAASLKHFTGNEQDADRFHYSAQMSERALRELYARPFEIALRGSHPWTVMGAYNKVNGRYACENEHLLRTILKGEWKYDGAIISDWGAWHDTARSIDAGCDLDMPGKVDAERDAREVRLVEQGKIDAAKLDDAVRRNLRLMFRTGGTGPTPPGEPTNAEHQAVSRRIAAASIVLLKNDRDTLPLNDATLRRLAVVGPAADWDCSAEDPNNNAGSGRVYPPHHVTPLEGLRAALPDVEVTHALGYSFDDRMPAVPADVFRAGPGDEAGLRAAWFDNVALAGDPKATRVEPQVDAAYRGPPAPGLPDHHYSARWTGQLLAPASGEYTFGLSSDDGSRLFIDGRIVVDDWSEHAARLRTGKVTLVAGRRYDLTVEYFNAAGDASVRLGWQRPDDARGDPIAAAVDAARDADAAVVCVGITHRYDREGDDKPTLDPIGPAAQLVRRVREANPRTIVVLTNGSPINVEPFADDVPAIVEQWYPGMEGGHALADVLLGRVNPSGKLPVTFGRRLADYGSHTLGSAGYPGVERVVEYRDDIFIGYRHFDRANVEPRFPFGHGLSYTAFAYSDATVVPAGDGWDVSFDLRNVGPRDGAEVAQLYVGQEGATVRRAPRELKGFAKRTLAPGESQRVTLHVSRADLGYWDDARGGWTVAPGRYRFDIGSSSRDLRAAVTLQVD